MKMQMVSVDLPNFKKGDFLYTNSGTFVIIGIQGNAYEIRTLNWWDHVRLHWQLCVRVWRKSRWLSDNCYAYLFQQKLQEKFPFALHQT